MNTRNIITLNEHNPILKVDNNTLLDFLKLFAQMEFRFKVYQDQEQQMPFINSGAQDMKQVIPKWGQFAKAIEESFNSLDECDVAHMAMLRLDEEPPKIQRIIGNKPKFIARKFTKEESPIQKLAERICDIRNNLFHGGKHMPRLSVNDEESETRDQDLVADALEVLKKFHYFFDQLENCSAGVAQEKNAMNSRWWLVESPRKSRGRINRVDPN